MGVYAGAHLVHTPVFCLASELSKVLIMLLRKFVFVGPLKTKKNAQEMPAFEGEVSSSLPEPKPQAAIGRFQERTDFNDSSPVSKAKTQSDAGGKEMKWTGNLAHNE